MASYVLHIFLGHADAPEILYRDGMCIENLQHEKGMCAQPEVSVSV
jgi:hypothetical protein